MDPDDVSQPLVVVFGWLEGFGEEASRVAPLLLPRAVSASDVWTCAPHEAQNLAPGGTAVRQEGQFTNRY